MNWSPLNLTVRVGCHLAYETTVPTPEPKPLRRNPAIVNRLKNSDASFLLTNFTNGKRRRLDSNRLVLS